MDDTIKSLEEYIASKMENLSEEIEPYLTIEDMTINNPELTMKSDQAMVLGYIRGQTDTLHWILKHIRNK